MVAAGGAISAVYMDNWGSGYTSSPTVTLPGGTGGTGASVQLYFNNPVTGIIGGWATAGSMRAGPTATPTATSPRCPTPA